MDKWIKFGGRYPLILLRLWRNGHGYIEDRWMDEHIMVEGGKTITLKNNFCDHNLNNLSFFINKHNLYAGREVIDILFDNLRINNEKKKLNAKNTSYNVSLNRPLYSNTFRRHHLPYLKFQRLPLRVCFHSLIF